MGNSLPKGWAEVELHCLADFEMGQAPHSSTYNEFKKGTPLIKAGDWGELYPDPAIYTSNPLAFAKEGDVIICVVGATAGKINLGIEAAITRSVAAIRPNREILLQKYLYYFLLTQYDKLNKSATGSAQPIISKDILKAINIPLPPLTEQHRIVAKLDTLLARVAYCKNRLEKIPALLENFRQSVLAAAVSGELTKEWRESNKSFEPYSINAILNEESDRPLTWRTTELGKLTNLVTSGSRGWAQYYASYGSLFIRAQNINSDYLDLSDIAYVNLPNATEGLRTKINKHDILITITGANVAKSAIVEQSLNDAYVSQHVALVRLKDAKLSKFVFLSIISPQHGRKILLDNAYGQGKPGLNLDNIKKLPIVVPPIEEQKEIIRKVEELFHVADSIEARYQKAKAWFDKLPQAILAKAFRGELVEQDENDEPTSVLLQRIKKEKQNTNKPKPTTKRKKIYEENEGVSLAAEE